jgi:hypothetical protein
MTLAVNIAQSGSNNQTMRNRIINGACVIDQRNNGAAVTLTEGGNNFIIDRFQTYKANSGVTITGQRSSVAPAGFINSLLFTTTTGASIGAANEGQFRQNIEGFNITDLAWGTAAAQPITLSFWVRSSLTGTFAAAIQSPSVDAVYVATYTISSANTFEYKTITIPGPTSGTFPTNNTTGFAVLWDIGGGSNFNAASANVWTSGNRYTVAGTQKVMATTGATFFITGVQLEEGTAASPFENRLYGTELALCKRYFEIQSGYGATTNNMYAGWRYWNGFTWSVEKRINPTVSLLSVTNTYPSGVSINSGISVSDKYNWAVYDTLSNFTLGTFTVSGNAEL